MFGLIEGLESRKMLSVTPAVASQYGTLSIQGTAQADTLKVAVNATDTTKLDVTLNGVTKSLPLAGVKGLVANLGAGNDSVAIASTLKLNTILNGGDGNDTLIGGAGNDLIIAGAGTDTVTGGAGADKFLVQTGDVLTDFTAGTDTKVIVGIPVVTPPPKPVTPPPVLFNGTLLIKGSNLADTLIVAVNGTDATKLDVTLNGKTTQYSVSAVKRIQALLGAGNDSATIGASVKASATLVGGDGNDTLIGGGGNDLIIGGGGADKATGGAGADRFVVTTGDTITDFVAGVDVKLTGSAT